MQTIIRRGTTAALLLITAIPNRAIAEDSVCLYGNYWKERSTRVISPMVRIRKDLPYDIEADVTYLVDQITSASGAFTLTDEPFSELRHEVRVGGSIKLFDMIRPNLRMRYSRESDYTSIGVSAGVSVELFEKSTVLDARFQYNNDDVNRRVMQGENTVIMDVGKLESTLVGVQLTQIFRKDLIGGVSLEIQLDRGFQENVYRSPEQHPTVRNRYAVAGWAAYRIASTKSTLRLDYRFYTDSWKAIANTIDIQFSQQIVPSLEIRPRFRTNIQKGVFFEVARPDDGALFVTSDPKLTTFNNYTFGGQIDWKLSFLSGTFLDLFKEARIQPSYHYVIQKNRYGNWHYAQLGVYWPY